VQTGAPQLEVAYVRSKQSGAILLEHQRGDFDYWLSSDEVQLILQKGLIHGTRGIGEGLLAAELSQPLYHILNLKSGHSDRFHTYLNGNDQEFVNLYWVDPSQRRILQSRQWIGPIVGYISTRVQN